MSTSSILVESFDASGKTGFGLVTEKKIGQVDKSKEEVCGLSYQINIMNQEIVEMLRI
jgi:hypothetical protein